MSTEGIVAVVVVLLVAMAVGAWRLRVGRQRQQRIAQLSSLVTELARDPRSGTLVDQLSSFPAVAVQGVPAHIVNALWTQSLTFALAHLEQTSGQTVLHRVVIPLTSIPGIDLRQFVVGAAELLAASPEKRLIHGLFLNYLRPVSVSSTQRQWLYERVLEQVQRSPTSPDLAILALEIGRWALGGTRPDGKPTVYDEQAIHNDIAVRRQGSLGNRIDPSPNPSLQRTPPG